jgi:hypothetical protein
VFASIAVLWCRRAACPRSPTSTVPRTRPETNGSDWGGVVFYPRLEGRVDAGTLRSPEMRTLYCHVPFDGTRGRVSVSDSYWSANGTVCPMAQNFTSPAFEDAHGSHPSRFREEARRVGCPLRNCFSCLSTDPETHQSRPRELKVVCTPP